MSIFLPQVTIQHDFQTVIAEVQEGIIPEEPFWVSCYKAEHDSVHGKVHVQRIEGSRIDVIPDPSGVEFRREEHVRTTFEKRLSCVLMSVGSTEHVLCGLSQTLYPFNEIAGTTTNCWRREQIGELIVSGCFTIPFIRHVATSNNCI